MSRDIEHCPKCEARYSVTIERHGDSSCSNKRCDWTSAQGWSFPKEVKLSKTERIEKLLDEIEKIRNE
jgi:hypothetical protein